MQGDRILIIQDLRNGDRFLLPLTDKQEFFVRSKWGEGPKQEQISEMLLQNKHPNYVKEQGEILTDFNIDGLNFEAVVLD
ncbi:MAG: hypothetical protein CMP39_04250 [Rickettsiales bacterium]|nr:hypothetical protein [Rickettsiales bacterium]|tara:strand:+ start:306 stop:545 length:240 start_codon:yes stop_codon:yes gene_type:complete